MVLFVLSVASFNILLTIDLATDLGDGSWPMYLFCRKEKEEGLACGFVLSHVTSDCMQDIISFVLFTSFHPVEITQHVD